MSGQTGGSGFCVSGMRNKWRPIQVSLPAGLFSSRDALPTDCPIFPDEIPLGSVTIPLYFSLVSPQSVNPADFKAIAWMVAEIGLIPALFVVLLLHFLRQVRDLREQNAKLVSILEKTNTRTLEMISDLMDARDTRAQKEAK